jgi:hypothetical protein
MPAMVSIAEAPDPRVIQRDGWDFSGWPVVVYKPPPGPTDTAILTAAMDVMQ